MPRGRGLGRGLLAAGEAATREHGIPALELNVFGANTTATELYRRSGYQVTTQHLRRDLTRPAPPVRAADDLLASYVLRHLGIAEHRAGRRRPPAPCWRSRPRCGARPVSPSVSRPIWSA
jgi:hypothetical protein